MERLVSNFSGTIRYENLNGKKYLVAPMSLIVPGVLNGSKGALYYPEEEIVKNVEAWNGMPIVVYHPTMDGKPLSARDPDVLNRQGIGFVFKAKYDKKLVAEGWFDLEATRRIDNRVLENLESGKETELSTGLFTDNEPASEGATFNSCPYDSVARNYRPDHLAILPDQVGACSVKDGCGVLVNQKGEDIKFHITSNELSHSDLYDQLSTALKTRFTQDEPSAWISEVFDTFIVYWQGDDLHKLSYSKGNNGVTLGSESPTKVVRETNFVTANKRETPTMAKKELVDQLIANCDCWSKDDSETLNSMADEKVQKLIDVADKLKKAELVMNAATAEFEDKQGGMNVFDATTNKWVHKEKEEKKEDLVINKEDNQTDEQWLEAAPSGIRTVVQNAMNFEAEQRKELCEQITANEVTDQDKQQLHTDLSLDSKPLSELKVLAKRLGKQPVVINKLLPSYFGQSGAQHTEATKTNEDDEPLEAPTINWAENAKAIA